MTESAQQVGVHSVRVAAIVPARNEATRIANTVSALRADARVDDVIVVDDASVDDTARYAANAGARAFRLRERVGKGGALAFGLRHTSARVILFIDGDLGETAAVAGSLLEPILAGTADMAIASPPPTGPSGFGFVESFARLGIRMLTGSTMTRPLSGQRALRREILDRFLIAPRFGVEVGLTVDALRAGFRVVEVVYPIRHARTGRTYRGFRHRARQGVDITRALTVRLLRRS